MNSEIIFWLSKLIDYKRMLLSSTTDLSVKSSLSHSIEAVQRAMKKIKKINIIIRSGQEAKELNIGVGDRIAKRIDEILTTGKLSELEEHENTTADIINDLMSVSGIGFEMAKKFQAQGITGADDLRRRYEAGKIKLTHAVILGLEYYELLKERIPRSEMEEIKAWLSSWMPDGWIIAGSYRRGCETSGDIDILITGEHNHLQEIVKAMKQAQFIIADLTPKANVKYMGIASYLPETAHHLDIRYIQPENWGTALLYFTGSKQFNIEMRNRAIDMGLSLSEYGLFKANGEQIETETEMDVFEALNMEYIPPELRGCSKSE